ncbi:hypothetical protein [Azospirillum sp. Sh1]|uniref:hypothetical protein n=1 Tax=Azospirillum sp. Sh1 TaxID=2607285 RepID=UPI0011EC4DDE|nr:hypothetical protein [Azospirillum sp. Sh1]KAA0582708.1 hypothetical protein FZ029_01025 [Azospirillum sp. Sh1]
MILPHAADHPALPPPEWKPPQAPVWCDINGPNEDPTLRLVKAINSILRIHGPMTAEQVGMALVIYGYGPMLVALDAPPTKRPRLNRECISPRWRQGRLPGVA